MPLYMPSSEVVITRCGASTGESHSAKHLSAVELVVAKTQRVFVWRLSKHGWMRTHAVPESNSSSKF